MLPAPDLALTANVFSPAACKQAQKLDTKFEVDFDAWSRLCRQGSLKKSAKDVMFACEKDVKLAPYDGNIRDSRGLARALTGNYQKAIADFEAYIADTDNKENKSQRQKWVKVLRAGKNPFTEEEESDKSGLTLQTFALRKSGYNAGFFYRKSYAYITTNGIEFGDK